MNAENESQAIEMSQTLEQPIDSHHSRNCSICRHPEREAIEEAFMQWHSGKFIAREFDVPWRSIYRHAKAANLFALRRRNVRNSLEYIIERSASTKPTADAIIRAVQLYTKINDAGELVETPKTQVIVISRDGKSPAIPEIPGLNIDRASLASPTPFHFRDLPGQLDNAIQTESNVNS